MENRLGLLKRGVPGNQLKLVKRKGGNAVIEEFAYEVEKISDHLQERGGKFATT